MYFWPEYHPTGNGIVVSRSPPRLCIFGQTITSYFCRSGETITSLVTSLWPDQYLTCNVILTRPSPFMFCHCGKTITSNMMSFRTYQFLFNSNVMLCGNTFTSHVLLFWSDSHFTLLPDHDFSCYVIMARHLPDMLCPCDQTFTSHVTSCEVNVWSDLWPISFDSLNDRPDRAKSVYMLLITQPLQKLYNLLVLTYYWRRLQYCSSYY